MKWLARVLFLSAVLAVAYGLWLRKERHAQAETEPLRKSPVRIDWPREEFLPWSSVEDGISVSYPARYDAVRGFGRFTSRDLTGGMEQTDIVAFRSGEPRSVIAIAGYRAARPLSWEQWIALVKKDSGQRSAVSGQQSTPSPVSQPSTLNPQPSTLTPGIKPLLTPPQPPTALAAEFGGSDKTYRRVQVGGRPALAVSARGAVRYPLRGNERMEMWRFESRLVAEGDRAVRITAGVHADQYESSRQGLQRTLESFRWNPPER